MSFNALLCIFCVWFWFFRSLTRMALLFIFSKCANCGVVFALFVCICRVSHDIDMLLLSESRDLPVLICIDRVGHDVCPYPSSGTQYALWFPSICFSVDHIQRGMCCFLLFSYIPLASRSAHCYAYAPIEWNECANTFLFMYLCVFSAYSEDLVMDCLTGEHTHSDRIPVW